MCWGLDHPPDGGLIDDWDYYLGPFGDSILVLILVDDEVVAVDTDRMARTLGDDPFDEDAWRADTKLRLDMIRDLLARDDLVGASLSDVRARLGRFDDEGRLKDPWGDETWELRVPCSRGLLNWDVFFYWPTEVYPDNAYGGSSERLDTWNRLARAVLSCPSRLKNRSNSHT